MGQATSKFRQSEGKFRNKGKVVRAKVELFKGKDVTRNGFGCSNRRSTVGKVEAKLENLAPENT